MNKPNITIIDIESGETTTREMNDAEFAQYEADQTTAAERAETEAAKAAEKEALLERLGITADEAKLLLS
jgi:hypothetical protein